MLGYIIYNAVSITCSVFFNYNPLFAYIDVLVVASRLVSPFQSSGGYDAPASTQDQDDLNRWALSRSVLRSIENTPDEWSIRVALYGKWGVGKTSILNFIARQIEERNQRAAKEVGSTQIIVVRFSAWDVTAVNGILHPFYRALLEQLPAKKTSKFSVFRYLKRALYLIFKGAKSLWDVLAGLFNSSIEPVSAGTIAAMRGTLEHAAKWTVFDKKDLARLQYELSGYRVVVFIDDLDRADPKIIPQTMLALRELLDWPKFAFILAFDLAVIAEALGTYSPVFGKDARRFLEKIIDVQLDVPEPTDKEVATMGRRLFASYCSFIPYEAQEKAIEWLPRNPRLAKMIVRDLGLLEKAAIRHEHHELNWTAIILQTILKHEAPDTMAAVHPALLGSGFHDISSASGSLELTKAAVALSFDDKVPADSVIFKRLEAKVFALQELRRREARARILYEMGLLTKEPGITLREYKATLDQWQLLKNDIPIISMLKHGEDACGESTDDIAGLLFFLVIMRCAETLTDATKEDDLHEYEKFNQEATSHMDLLEYLCYQCEVPAVKSISTDVRIWRKLVEAAVQMHRLESEVESDCLLRRMDELVRFSARRCNAPVQVVDFATFHLNEEKTHPFYYRESTKNLYNSIVQIMAQDAIDDAVKYFYVAGALEEIYKGVDQDSKIRRIRLDDLNSPVYSSQGLQAMVKAFHSVTENHAERLALADNAVVYLEYLQQLKRKCDISDGERLKEIYSVVVPAAWQAILTGRQSTRRPKYLIRKREDFINRGFNEEWLPL
ncbi:hypothetical protein C4K03_3108 [Pseudomonas synxantha]|uniref:KAP NTPase domain-containing protein n=1 Tax=Pseudomonas synxantha TaxID=47883 RepID=A0A3G7U7I9_9PSED|nr:P-loop NTPase fold protein [Pseudomonas synxantha]AZE55263.1 hypothetical protein C4K03_3108 [Pseudomonas synxantha]